MTDGPDKSNHDTTVICAISGGVDSAVAAWLLLREGYRVEGLHMTNWEDDDGYCTAAQDLRDARQICTDLGIPLHPVNFTREYRDRVFADFLREYAAGRTPNPDVLCNREIKFGVMLEYAQRLGGGLLATGHYARIRADGCLLKGVDPGKDQSYFLHQVSREALARTRFPLGDRVKAEVRRIANQAGLAVYDKPDSTGICFIGERPFREFLARFIPGQPGDAMTPAGQVVGTHEGLAGYTLGQRQGLGIGGWAGGTHEPWFVAGKDAARNALIVVQGRAHPLLWSIGLTAGPVHWITGPPAALDGGELRCCVKTRYRQADIDCTVHRLADDSLNVRFDSPQWAVTPGQYAVFYARDECLGGGPIMRAVRSGAPAPAGTAGSLATPA
ncbi:MAG: tRNA 2-thiouridine(34) synthase MnmA [Gammaproteobacteria bacterium]|nr:MAG: tRNA 2-thiouridine(34) synthase MnmA [Gammaproteobacteria bacterium]